MISQQLQCVRQRLAQLDTAPATNSVGHHQTIAALKTEAQRLLEEWTQFSINTSYRHRIDQLRLAQAGYAAHLMQRCHTLTKAPSAKRSLSAQLSQSAVDADNPSPPPATMHAFTFAQPSIAQAPSPLDSPPIIAPLVAALAPVEHTIPATDVTSHTLQPTTHNSSSHTLLPTTSNASYVSDTLTTHVLGTLRPDSKCANPTQTRPYTAHQPSNRPDVLTLGGTVSEGSSSTARRTSSSSVGGVVALEQAMVQMQPPPAKPRGKLAPLAAKLPPALSPNAAPVLPRSQVVAPSGTSSKVSFAAEAVGAESDDSEDVQALLQQRGPKGGIAARAGRLAPLRPITPHPAALHKTPSDAVASVDVFDQAIFDF